MLKKKGELGGHGSNKRDNNLGIPVVITQVWVTKRNLGKKAEDIPIPSTDVTNILHELHFKDEVTRSRCRGWLTLTPRQYLRADILFPGCEFDCRLTIRGRTGKLWYKYLMFIMRQTTHPV